MPMPSGDVFKSILEESIGKYGQKDLTKEALSSRGPRTASQNRNFAQRSFDMNKHMWDNGGTAGKAFVGANVGMALGAGALVASQAQDHPLGSGAVVLGTAVALAARPNHIAAMFGERGAQAAAKTVAHDLEQPAAKIFGDTPQVAEGIVSEGHGHDLRHSGGHGFGGVADQRNMMRGAEHHSVENLLAGVANKSDHDVASGMAGASSLLGGVGARSSANVAHASRESEGLLHGVASHGAEVDRQNAAQSADLLNGLSGAAGARDTRAGQGEARRASARGASGPQTMGTTPIATPGPGATSAYKGNLDEINTAMTERSMDESDSRNSVYSHAERQNNMEDGYRRARHIEGISSAPL